MTAVSNSRHTPGPHRIPTASTELSSLVDALVDAVDTDREEAVDRLHLALEPFGAARMFAAELRLNGRSSEQVWALLAEEGAL